MLILSVFPGIDLLGRAFEEEWPEACLVRGPDPIFGGDIRSFHPPSGVFDGVIGGPPCQAFSRLVHLVRANGHEPKFGNLIPEFERVVAEAQPAWFLMENVPAAPVPAVSGYRQQSILLDNRWVGGEQSRRRRITFGSHAGWRLDLEYVALAPAECFETVISGNGFGNGAEYYRRVNQAVLSNQRAVPVKIGGSGKVKSTAETRRRRPLSELCELQGLPAEFLEDAPFTSEGKLKAIANGVPLPMGRAIARAIKRAMEAR